MNSKDKLFRDMSVNRAVLTLIVPTVISQLITLVYNLADTFFIGQLNDPRQVAAATIAMPCFIALTAFSNLFGIGGASRMSRCLGKGDEDGARKTAAFSIWTAVTVSLTYGAIVLIAAPSLLPMLGAKADTYSYCYSYVFWTVVTGAAPTVLNVMFSHLIRAEGYSKEAGFGVAMGGILNIILDPVFIFVFKMEITGAAIATMLSNLIATLYFVIFIYKIRNKSSISLLPKYFSAKDGIAGDVLMGGLPSFTMMILSCVSNTVLNNLLTARSTEAMAGMGIAKKIDMIAFSVAQGMTQGVLPLIAYNYASGNRKRMNKSILVTMMYALTFSMTSMFVLYFFSEPLVRLFIQDAATVAYGQKFLKIICFLCPSIAVNYMAVAVFQATKRRAQSIILSILRKGSLDVPLMIILNRMFGVDMVPWATPISDWTTLVIALFMLIPFIRSMQAETTQTN